MKKIKKSLGILFIIIIGVLLLMSVRSLFTGFPTAVSWQENKVERPANFETQVKKLSGGIQIPTVSYTDTEKTDFSRFAAFRDYLKKKYPAVFEKMEYSLINENTMLLVWRGTNAGLNPILFNAHYDVVPAYDSPSTSEIPFDVSDDLVHTPIEAPTAWTYPPFSGAVKNGRMYGRGTLDVKSMLFALMNAAETLMEQGFRPQRDIYFAFTHDEEVGSENGAKKIVEYLKSQPVFLDAVYDEGGLVQLMKMKGETYGFAMVGVAEKGYLTVRIKVSANAGHSSTPPLETTLGKAAVIIQRLENNQMPARISPDFEVLLKNVASIFGFPAKIAVANNDVLEPVFTKILSTVPMTNAAIRTTTAVTGAKGSDAENVLLGVAEIIVNFRLFPGDKIDDVIKHVEKQCKGFDTQIEVLTGREAAKVSPTDTKAFRKMEESIKSVFPAANIVPYVTLAATDSRNYQEVSDNIYRFMPIAVTPVEVGTIHGYDESITLDNYLKMMLYFEDLLRRYDDGCLKSPQ